MHAEPSQQLLVTKKEGDLRKPNDMIVLIPRSSRVTLIGRKIYNAMLQIAQTKMLALNEMPPADFVFECPLPLILKSTGSGGEDRTIAKKYIKEMISLNVEWTTSTPEGPGDLTFNMLSQAAIEIRNGENWVSWAYPPTIMKLLREPGTWTRLDLNLMARLGTYAAVALYEICARYKNHPRGLTSSMPVSWWANALSQTPAGSEKREWRKFKNERVKPAIDEINRETDLEIEMIEFKQGRAVAEVQFNVRKKKIPTQRPNHSSPVDAGLVLRAEMLGIREIKLEQLLNEFPEDAVRAQIEVLERKGTGKHLGQINRFAELRGLLRGERTESAVVQHSISFREEANHDAKVGSDDEGRTAQLRTEILALDDQAKRHLGQRAAELLAAKGLLSAVVTRRLEQGDILHGLLGATVVQLYQEAAYGTSADADRMNG